jgi:hypothetical protein
MGRPKKVLVADENLSEIDILKQQINELLGKVNALTGEKSKNNVSQENLDFEDIDQNNSIKINGDDYIKVISLCPYTLNLSTQSKGRGKLYTFTKFGEVKRIVYRDLIDIIENHSNFLNDGLFLIMNRDVIRRHGLDDLYSKLLTKEKIEEILQGNQSDAVNMFRSANPRQQEMICNMIISDMVDGKEMDLNFIDRLSRVVGYNIIEKVEDAKKLRVILADKTVT